jgi:hypothetical protein
MDNNHKQALLDALNGDLASEFQAVIMYTTYSAMVKGPYRPQLKEFMQGEIPDRRDTRSSSPIKSPRWVACRIRTPTPYPLPRRRRRCFKISCTPNRKQLSATANGRSKRVRRVTSVSPYSLRIWCRTRQLTSRKRRRFYPIGNNPLTSPRAISGRSFDSRWCGNYQHE